MANQRISAETQARIDRLWPDILEGVARGHEIRAVFELAGISRDMARAYMDVTPAAREQWNNAKSDSADAFFDEVQSIANNREDDPARARVRMDAYRWLAGKRNPREYSDKATLDVNVRTVDLTRIINDAQARLEASRQVGNAALLAPIMGIAQRVLDDSQEPSA